MRGVRGGREGVVVVMGVCCGGWGVVWWLETTDKVIHPPQSPNKTAKDECFVPCELVVIPLDNGRSAPITKQNGKWTEMVTRVFRELVVIPLDNRQGNPLTANGLRWLRVCFVSWW